MGRTSIDSLRIFQGLLAAANLGLSAYVVHWYLVTTRRGSPASLNFLVFASVFSILSLLHLELAPRLCPRAAHPYGCLSVEACNALFYFAAFIAHAVFLGSLAMCRGTVCTVGRVDSVVAAAAFCAWSASTILTAKKMFMTGVRKSSADHANNNKATMQDA
ncbi:hypothetical protein G6O67_000167 [Ophiocordyceps sinensis]|uniref:MARVEL domain-containing protein n=1 Tax=Ophiocordyceps sinensis TaxID=72228 RepID=A0A8H4PYJ5_9HYPO|nr:hypothetical protein G6O67_000167 [Ophiocordyceps sinensis]